MAIAVVDEERGGRGVGVPEESRRTWRRYRWGDDSSQRGGDDEGGERDDSRSLLEVEEKASPPSSHTMSIVDAKQSSCPICLCDYEGGDGVILLPCHHIYHESCISSWAAHRVKCPMCNYDLVLDGPNRASMVSE